MITIFIDGSSRGNPGTGGYGIVIFEDADSNNILFARSAQYSNVTNNQMELMALLHALDYVEDHYPNEPVMIYSDSSYVVNSWNSWLEIWANNGWKNSKKQQVENIALMKALWEYCSIGFFHCTIAQCKGHDGVIGNELADLLARNQVSRFYKETLDEGYTIENFEQNDFLSHMTDFL